MGVVRNWFFVWFFVCSAFRVFLGFCGWVPEALRNPAQMRMPDGPAFRGSPKWEAFRGSPKSPIHLWTDSCLQFDNGVSTSNIRVVNVDAARRWVRVQIV